MKKNDLINVKCEYLSYDCKGVCKGSNNAFYIPFLLPDEEARIRVTNISGKTVYGQIDTIIKESSDRKVPRCKSYMKCGSCQLMHYDYSKQLEFKKNNVYLDFKKEGINVTVSDTLGMKNPYNYRNKVIASFGIKNKEIIYGLYEERSHNIIDNKDCMIQNENLNKILLSIKELMKKLKIYPVGSNRGVIRHVLLRIGLKTNEVMVVFVTNSDIFPGRNELTKQLVDKHKDIKTVIQNTNSRITSIVLGDKERILFGPGFIFDELLGIRFKISAKSFYQVNPVQTEVLYREAIKLADLKKTDVVLDAYCGIGTISLAVSDKCRKVIGVEIVKEAICDAINNAKINKIENAKFYCDDAKRFMQNLNEKIDCLILDPPRSGCGEDFIKSLVKLRPQRIVYVSCNSETQAKDIKGLVDYYKIIKVQPVDMFAFTSHVENIVLFTKV